MRYAGFWIRVLASLFDSIFIILLSLPTYLLNDPYEFIAQLVVAFLYETILTSGEHQATWGKRLMGLKVTNLRGGRLSYEKSVGRYIGKLLSTFTLFIGFVMVAFTDRKQGLHDRLADTLVIFREDPDEMLSSQSNVSRNLQIDTALSVRDRSGWVMAGFDESGHVRRFRFDYSDDRLVSDRGLRIGRSESENDLIVPDGSVSRVHAKLFLRGGQLFLEDLGSRNGSFIGGVRLHPGEGLVVHGDQEVRFGDVTFSVGKE